MKQFKNIYFQFILSLILTATLVTGCVAPGPRPGKDSPDQAGTPAESPASYEKYEKATLETQEHFDQMMNDLFLDEVDNSLITLHYTLADPAAFGITDYDKTLGTVSLEDTKQALNDAKSLKVQLNDIDSRYLREDQLLTYTILSSYLNTMLDSEGMELYDQPLSSSLGIQSQLPILLSEYVFYTRQDVEDYLSLLSPLIPTMRVLWNMKSRNQKQDLDCATLPLTGSSSPATHISWTRTTASWQRHFPRGLTRWRG